MLKTIHIGIASLIIILFCFFSGIRTSSGNPVFEIKFEGSTLSARIEEVPLGQVIEMLAREKGIWLSWEKSLYDEKISIQFKDIPLEQGLGRILSNINYAFIYDQDKRLVGLIILGKKGSDGSYMQGEVSKNPFSTSAGQTSSENAGAAPQEAPQRHQFPKIDKEEPDIAGNPPFGISKPPQNQGTGIEIFPY